METNNGLTSKWVRRDHKRHVDNVTSRAANEKSNADLALIGALALTAEFSDEVAAFDKALTVVEALGDSGVVFAYMSSCGDTGQ